MDRSKVIQRYSDYEDRLLVNKILDTEEFCKKNYTYKATSFLDPRQQSIVEELLDYERDISYILEGGLSNSERKLCIVYHDDLELEHIDIPLETIEFSWSSKFAKKPSHRDFLGSLIGSGIKREMIGDIMLQEETAYVVCAKEISEFILFNIDRVGSIPVKSVVADEININKEDEKIIHATVASLRLDSIISAGFRISRTKAAEVIKSGKARVNWEEKDLTSKTIKQGDVISLRGKGRMILEEITGNTKKDRIKITIRKFV